MDRARLNHQTQRCTIVRWISRQLVLVPDEDCDLWRVPVGRYSTIFVVCIYSIRTLAVIVSYLPNIFRLSRTSLSAFFISWHRNNILQSYISYMYICTTLAEPLSVFHNTMNLSMVGKNVGTFCLGKVRSGGHGGG